MEKSSMFTVTPMSQQVEIDPGDSCEGDIILTNPLNASGDFDYKVELSSYNVVGDDYNADFLTVTEHSQIVNWITIDNPTGTLKPNESVKVHYKINVPEKAVAGGQYAAFLVSSAGDEAPISGIAVSNVFEMASILYVQVSGDIIRKGEMLGAEVPGFVTSTPIKVTSSFKNEGSLHEPAYISLEARSYFSSTPVYPKAGESGVLEEIIMPGTTRTVTREIDGVSSLGIYDVTQTISYMDEVKTIRQVVIACPIWFMALVIITIMAIVSATVMRIKRHHLKRKVF